MKWIMFTSLFFVLFGCKQKANDKDFECFSFDTNTQFMIFNGNLVDVYAERNIYTKTGEQNFFLKFTIVNKTDSLVGVDLSDFWRVLYPNQWEISNKTIRDIIDERQIIPDSVIDENLYFNKLENNELTNINPYQRIIYFREWNGSGEKPELKNKDEYLLISIDGQLICTNGRIIEHINFNNCADKDRVVVIGFPLKNVLIVNNPLIIKK